MNANPLYPQNIQSLAFAAALFFGAVSAQALVVTTGTESNSSTFTPTWDSTLATGDVLLGLTPTTVLSSESAYQEESAAGTSILTNGASGPQYSLANVATVGDGCTLVYTLSAAVTLDSIVIYSAWGNHNRTNLNVDVYYKSSVSDPTWISLGNASNSTVDSSLLNPMIVQVALSSLGDVSASQLEFVFHNAGTFAYNGISEIAAYAVPEPSTWIMLVGGLGVFASSRRFRKF